MSNGHETPNFAILMTAYNGMRWIDEQLESILNQEDVRVTIHISVDQSTDETLQWCKDRAEHEPRIIVLPLLDRFGNAAKNFFRLIRDVDFSNFDYVAFADQDDIWLSDKLATADRRMREGQFSAYSGNVLAFWPNGRKLLINKAQRQRKYDFLFEGGGPGCSYVVRTADAMHFKAFLVEKWGAAQDISDHDWLIYAWFRATGLSWYIDPDPKLLYRQHSANQIGANSGLKAVKARMSLLRSQWYRTQILRISSILCDKLPDLPPSIVERGVVPRPFLFKNANQLRRRFRDRIFLALIIATGFY